MPSILSYVLSRYQNHSGSIEFIKFYRLDEHYISHILTFSGIWQLAAAWSSSWELNDFAACYRGRTVLPDFPKYEQAWMKLLDEKLL